MFLGGGALLFKLRHHTSYVNEINYSLINLYKIIIEDLENFISEISQLEYNYNSLNVEDKKNMYDKLREEYNIIKSNNNNKPSIPGALNIKQTGNIAHGDSNAQSWLPGNINKLPLSHVKGSA